MDMSVERGKFEYILADIPDERVRSGLLEQYDDLAAIHGAADAAGKAKAEAMIAQLYRSATVAARSTRDMSTAFYLLLGFIVLLCFGSLWGYFWGIGPGRYILIEATRPVLVFTLIIAMLGFGGTLIFKALFSSEPPDEAQKRFRLAREIFLVYSGIFGTIIGFYFGAASGEAVADPPALGAPTIQRDGLVNVQVSKGTAPYSGTIRLAGEDADRTLSLTGDRLSIQLDRAQDCPAGAKIVARDGGARTVELTIEQTPAALLALGWAGCQDEAEAASEQSAAADNAVEDQTNSAENATDPAT